MKKLASIVTVCAMFLFMAGCGTPSPEQATKSFLEAFQSTDFDRADELYEGNWDEEQIFELSDLEADSSEALSELLLEKALGFDFTVGEIVEQNDDTATVEVQITAYNIGEAFANAFVSYFGAVFSEEHFDDSEEEMSALFEEIFLQELEATTKTYIETVPVELIKVDDTWMVRDFENHNEALTNAILGGLMVILEGFGDLE